MTNDLVSDMLTRIRNASLAKHNFTRVKYSKLNLAILKKKKLKEIILMAIAYTIPK